MFRGTASAKLRPLLGGRLAGLRSKIACRWNVPYETIRFEEEKTISSFMRDRASRWRRPIDLAAVTLLRGRP